MTKERRYTVSGIDDQGDVHTFATDDPERAKAMHKQFSEDLTDVEAEVL